MERWARTRRQKVIRDISFESAVHNIYDPHYTSEEENRIEDLEGLVKSMTSSMFEELQGGDVVAEEVNSPRKWSLNSLNIKNKR